jgi:RNA polymerase sigma factor (sigma-70 family)
MTNHTTAAPPDTHDDTMLVQACLAGDGRAWESLVTRYQRLVYSVALRCGLNADDADDVFQVVFTTLFRRLPGLRDHNRLASWLITTTYRESWRVGRSARGRMPLDETVIDVSTPAPELVAQADRDQRVRDAMERLDERCRRLLTALFLEHDAPSYGDIAVRFGVPVGSIGPTRARCFKKLETLLGEAGID